MLLCPIATQDGKEPWGEKTRRSAREKRGKNCHWEAPPEEEERWLVLGLQASGLKLLRTDEKWALRAWEGGYGSGSGECMGRHSVLLLGVL